MNSNFSGDNRFDKAGPAGKGAPTERRVAVVNHQIDSQALFENTREIGITHGGELYRLRLTAQNKLILTK